MAAVGQTVCNLLDSRLTPLDYDTDVSVETWLRKINQPKWRKDELELVNKLVVEYGPATYAQATVKFFTKDEGYLEFKQARGINARKDEMKVRFGRIFSRIEEEVYKLPEFIKHVPVKDRAKYITERLNRAGVTFFNSDFVAYESLFTREVMMNCERQLYDYMTSKLPEHDEFMKQFDKYVMGMNYIESDAFRAHMEATRMSGEMCTSLGNGWTTMCIVYHVCEKVGFKNVQLVVEGDDNACSGEGQVPTAQDFADVGFLIKIETFASFAEMSFCGLVFDETDQEVVTDPRKVLATFAWTSREYVNARSGKLKALLRCKALSLAHQYRACPVVTALAHYLLRVTSGADVRRIKDARAIGAWMRELVEKELITPTPRGVPGPGSRDLVERAFGINVETQLLLEAYFDNREGIGQITETWIRDLLPDIWHEYYESYSMGHVVGHPGDAGFWWPTASEQRQAILDMLPDLAEKYTPPPRSR